MNKVKFRKRFSIGCMVLLVSLWSTLSFAGTYSDAAKNAMLGALSPAYASLHNGNPGTTGANEISGGSPAYARKATTFNAASAGSRALNADVTFDVPAITVQYVCFWTAVTAGTFYGCHDVTDETYAAQGQYKLLATGTSLSITD